MTCCLCRFRTNSLAKCKNGSCQICSKAAMLDAEIDQAVAALQRLLTKRCDLRSEQNQAHDIMHRLPLELKNCIFELALPTRDEWGRVVGGRWEKMPSFLSSICRNWRDIAQSIPFFWSTILIVLGAPSTSNSSWVDLVYNWIQRSGKLPLRLHISVDLDYHNYGSEDDLEEQLNDVLDVMAQCPNEWHSLFLNIPSSFLYILYNGDNFKSHLPTVRRLRILCTRKRGDVDQLAHPIMSPETIEIDGLTFKSLPISWNHLTSAKVICWDLEDIARLFQHASQMICCDIFWRQVASGFTMPPIIHRTLQTLRLHHDKEAIPMLLDSLTLPCLRSIETDIVVTALLPSLVRRSSCPLTRITILKTMILPSGLHPLPGVTNLVLKEEVYNGATLKVLLLEGYFPDLRHLTLPLRSFVILWNTGVILMLLDRNRPMPNEVPLRNISVVDPQGYIHNRMWDFKFWKQMKAFQSNIRLREGGFEFLIPEGEMETANYVQ